jgi:hypothetical protein
LLREARDCGAEGRRTSHAETRRRGGGGKKGKEEKEKEEEEDERDEQGKSLSTTLCGLNFRGTLPK